ncbi:MAG: asparagine synthase (glutamine-hydrolyzing) [Saprospiraceae bacterium]|nr:asparagine synthase (glutamine-hydrolyzing) [Saprospiraceae bacterium]
MCGILGLVAEDQLAITKLDGKIIQHRGPDDDGYFESDGIKLIHYRLSILDLSDHAHQPMSTDDGRFVIVYNGEIYNHLEIRQELGSEFEFKSQSDTETILLAFSKWGVNTFAKLNGIFALAVYDTTSRELFLARDPFGVKPLYYCHQDEFFGFSSELKALVQISGFDKTLDYKAIFNYIQYLYAPGIATAFQHVRKLDSGSYLKLSLDHPEQFEIIRYYNWPLSVKKSDKTEKQWVDELDALLQQAVKRQLQSDVPVGYFISGGLDSSLLAAMHRKLFPNQSIKGFTISDAINKEEGFDEDLPFAKLLAAHLNLDLEVISSQKMNPHALDNMIWHMDEPQGDAVPLYIDAISKLAREKGYYVLISGMGGDDLFSGYRRHQAYAWDPYLAGLPLTFRRWIKSASHILPDDIPKFRRLRKLLSNFDYKDLNERLVSYFDWIGTEETRQLFSEQVKTQLHDYDPHDIFLKELKDLPKDISGLTRQLYLESRYYLPDHNLNYTDKIGMKHGVEIRVPFLDKDLVQFSFSLPDPYKLKGNTTKYLLRKLGERYLPPEILYRKKTGFGGPVRRWIKNELQSKIDTELSAEKLKKLGIFNPHAVHALLVDNKSGKRDAAYSILALLAIQTWIRQFVKN